MQHNAGGRHREEGLAWKCLEIGGPWPFVTRRVWQGPDCLLHPWTSRAHRKTLGAARRPWSLGSLLGCLWAPDRLNWWIGALFAFGSLLFMLGSVLSLAPALASAWLLSATEVNAVFFMGSMPFTTAAYLQLYQAANAPPHAALDAPRPVGRRLLFGWRPGEVGWLSAALQFVGTLLFNLNTFDAMIPGLTWWEQDLDVWVPNMAGSMLFLASGYLAFIETCHAHWAWTPGELSWWVAVANLFGCIGFMVAALVAFVPSATVNGLSGTLSLAFTLQGAVGFLIGSLLMLPEDHLSRG